ncbi:hypothetical protein AWW66_21220 [Micromonospora rosaria]|uniref:WD40 repeat domain-containing protein n=2 Tax=Micromonospora rosaria TaxID=47874 RepID=A0A136PND5_9ACTN|nr:hypothetical protein AWW66_21220 [Micromonospora rosaria]
MTPAPPWRWTIAAAALLVLVAGTAAPGLAAADHDDTAAAPPVPRLSVPDRLGPPQWGAWEVRHRPVAAAPAIFTAENWWYEPPSLGSVAVVAAGTDDYRLLASGWPARAGEDALLSPDGRTVALPNHLVETHTGRTRSLPSVDGTGDSMPAAWSPDGDLLALVGIDGGYAAQQDGVETYTVRRAVLAVSEVASGRLTTVADLRPDALAFGWLAAFAPDGRTLAYQAGDSVVVATVDGRTLHRFPVPPGTRLAGKGAWIPDGTGLTLVDQRRCCTGDAYAARWQLRVVSPNSGRDLPHAVLPEQAGLVALRLLGWAPDGAAVVARYRPEPGITVAGFDAPDGITNGAWTATDTDVVALDRQGAARTVLVGVDQAVHGIDVADQAIGSGLTHSGHLPPRGVGPRYRRYAVVAGTAGVLLVAGLAVGFTRRSRRRTATHSTAPAGSDTGPDPR